MDREACLRVRLKRGELENSWKLIRNFQEFFYTTRQKRV